MTTLHERLLAEASFWRGWPTYQPMNIPPDGATRMAALLLEAATALQSSGGEVVADGELPGMRSHSDITGGDPDERSHAERTASPAQPGGFVLVPVERGLDERVNDDSFRALVHGFRSQIGARRPSDSDPEDQWAWDKATDLLALLLTAAPAPIEQEG